MNQVGLPRLENRSSALAADIFLHIRFQANQRPLVVTWTSSIVPMGSAFQTGGAVTPWTSAATILMKSCASTLRSPSSPAT